MNIRNIQTSIACGCRNCKGSACTCGCQAQSRLAHPSAQGCRCR